MKVLIPVQDQFYADTVAKFVASHKWPENTTFRLLNVDNFDALCGFAGQMPCQHSHDYALEKRRRIRAFLLDVASKIQIALPEARVEQVALSGYAPDVILTAAQDWPAEMIVMGSHGRGAFDRLMLGSVSLAVLTHAKCTVMIVRCSRQSSSTDSKAEVGAVTTGAAVAP